MSCGCKKKDNLIKTISEEEGIRTELNFFEKILKFFGQFFFGIFVGALIIIMTVPLLIYVIVNLMFGKEIKFKIKKPFSTKRGN